MNQLEPCPHCQRHVNVSETACPFCTRDVAEAFAHRVPRVAPRVRLGRAATFAFGVLAMGQGACDSTGPRIDAAPSDTASIPIDAQPDAGVPEDADYDASIAIYSAAPTPDAATTSGATSDLGELTPDTTSRS